MNRTERLLLWGGFVISWVKPVLKVINTIIGFGGFPDDLATWSQILRTIIGGYAVFDWVLLTIGTACLLLVLVPPLQRLLPLRPRPAHVFDTELREEARLGDFVEAEVAPAPATPPPALKPSTLENLLARRDDLQQAITKQNPADHISLMIAGYRECIRQYSAKGFEIIRPHRVAMQLNKWIQDVEQVFARVGPAFALGVSTPEMPELDDADSAGDPPMYRSANNQAFIRAHKRNLAAYEGSQNELFRKVSEMQKEIDRLTGEIEVEKGRLQ